MSLFDPDPFPEPDPPTAPPAAADTATKVGPLPHRPRPTVHQAANATTLTPVCGADGGATVLPSLVDCPACLSLRKAAERPPQTVYRRDGICLACSAAATDGEWCPHHAQIVARATS